MKKIIQVVLTAAGVLAGFWLMLRFIGRQRHTPCPYWLSGLLENPLVEAIAGAAKILDLLEVDPGMTFLDVGSGPGRITLPAAQRVGPEGQVTALDIQPEMLAMVKERANSLGIDNVRLVQGEAGAGLLEEAYYDRAVLVTVLGETPDKNAVMEEIYSALKPGGWLAVAEYLPDPDFQTQAVVHRLAAAAGFREVLLTGKPWGYIMILEK